MENNLLYILEKQVVQEFTWDLNYHRRGFSGRNSQRQ
jgi:hypothetical protein